MRFSITLAINMLVHLWTERYCQARKPWRCIRLRLLALILSCLSCFFQPRPTGARETTEETHQVSRFLMTITQILVAFAGHQIASLLKHIMIDITRNGGRGLRAC